MLTVVSRDRSCHRTKAENSGTKKPWEKLGSFHHCATRWASVGPYIQNSKPARTAVCQKMIRPRFAARARMVDNSGWSTWLTRTDSIIKRENGFQHKRSGFQSQIESLRYSSNPMVSVGHRRWLCALALRRGRENSLGNISSFGTIEDERLFPSIRQLLSLLCGAV